MTAWALEMETLILGWYVLVQTGSVVWLTGFAALQFIGTLVHDPNGATHRPQATNWESQL